MAATTPQDHKKKAVPFRFEIGGKPYTLPPASKYAAKVSGGVTADAILEPDNDVAQLRLALAMFQAIEGHDDAKDALRAAGTEEMFGVVGKWMEYGDGDGASVPQS